MKSFFPKSLKTNEKVCFKTMDQAVYDEQGVPLSNRINYKHLKMGILGDGIVSGAYIDNAELTYANLLKKNFYSVDNKGIGGSTLTKLSGRPDNKVLSLIYTELAEDLDVILVAFTSSDWSTNAPMGEDNSTDISTFKGAMNVLATGLLNRYYDKDIIFITPLQLNSVLSMPNNDGVPTPSNMPNAEGLILKDYADAIKEYAMNHSIPVIDLFATSGLDFVYNDTHKEFLSVDTVAEGTGMAAGVHPNYLGHEKLYRRVLRGIQSYV